MIGLVVIGGYYAWKHKDEISSWISPQQATAAPAPAPVPAPNAEPLHAACCVCHEADSGSGFECLVVADPGKVYKYKKANSVEEATALCIVDHCSGVDKDDEGNDLPPRKNRQDSKKGADDVTDLLNKRIKQAADIEASKSVQTGYGDNQCPPGQVIDWPCDTVGTQLKCKCKKASSKYTRAASYYGSMGYSSYDTRQKWKNPRNNGKHWGWDKDHDHDHWDSKHVWRLPRPIVRSNVVVYNPFAYYYAPPPVVYAPPVFPIQYW